MGSAITGCKGLYAVLVPIESTITMSVVVLRQKKVANDCTLRHFNQIEVALRPLAADLNSFVGCCKCCLHTVGVVNCCLERACQYHRET